MERERTAAFFTAIRYNAGDPDVVRRVFLLQLSETWRVPPWEIEQHPEWIDDAISYAEAKAIEQKMVPYYRSRGE